MNMGRGSRWTWIIALSVGFGLAGLARGDDDAKPAKTGNWFTRLFTRDSAPKKKENGAKKDDAAPSAALLRQKAYWEWQRRLEVCDKLKQIAFETGDKDLDRKADALDQRAWDVYVQRTGGPKGDLSPDEQFLEGRLGMEAAQVSRDTRTASAALDGRTAGRKD
jgi:hypothetical protein